MPGSRLRLAGRQGKPGHSHHKDEPQNYKGSSAGCNEYRSDSFHHAPFRNYLHLRAESTPCQAHTRDFGLYRWG